MAYTTINKGSSYFNTVLYTGDGTGARAITGVGFQPDLVWLKTRSTAFNHQLHDRVRGATAGALYSSLTNAQDPNYPITSFNSDGFTLGNSASLIADSFGSQNFSGTTMCSWNWLASNTSGSSNTAGTITSTVSANTTAGFSIVSYTGNGTGNSTIGHGLGAVPKFIIVKSRTTTDAWGTLSASYVSAADPNILYLNSTAAEADDTNVWGTSANFTSSTFTVGTWNGSNYSGTTYIAYCWSEIKGYSKFGKYTGNGSADGTFVYTGFKPAFVIIKRSDSGVNSWHLVDNKRNTFNGMTLYLNPNSSGAEQTYSTIMDFTSNGFKLRDGDPTFNASGGTFIYMAFAENPFVTSGGIPVTAR